MNPILIVSIALIFLFSSCNNQSVDIDGYLVDISEFNIQNGVLKDGDFVEILGSTDKISLEGEHDFYNLIVVKSEETGDTINVLLTSFYQTDLNNPRTQFISNSSLAGKLLERSRELKDLTNDKLNNLKAKTFEKVFYDHDFIQVDVRQYPSIPGTLGEYYIDSNSQELN